MRDGQQPVDGHRQTFIQLDLALEAVEPHAKRGPSFRRDLVLEVLDVRRDGLRGFGLSIGEVAEQVHIVEAGEGAGQVVIDERQGPAHRFDANLDEDARWFLDVVARRLNDARSLTQLREHAAGAIGDRSMREQGLTSQARSDDVRVVLGIAFPGAHLLELEHAAAQVRAEHAVFEPFGGGQPGRVDLVQTAQVAGQGASLGVDRVTAEVLEQIVVDVNAVECGVRRMCLVQVPEQIVDEVGKWFGNGHGSYNGYRAPEIALPLSRSVNGTINIARSCPARSSWSPRRSATSKT